MKLTLTGHDDRYAVEQLQMSLFPAGAEVEAVSRLTREAGQITVTSTVQLNGSTFADTLVQSVLSPLRSGVNTLALQAERIYDYIFSIIKF